MAQVPRSSTRQLAFSFDDAPVWDVLRLEAAIAGFAQKTVKLALTQNRSVLMSFRRERGAVKLRLHTMFLPAPGLVVRALAQGLRRKDRGSDGVVRRFMNENLHRVRRVKRMLPPLVTAGRAHDLRRVFDDLNERFFGGLLEVPITWGRGVGRARRGGLTFGSYDPVLALIRIHPVLDRSDVPRYFIESVVHHEMLHHKLGGTADRAGRTVYHTRAFRAAEARYPHHKAALAWEKENLKNLLRASRALDRRRKAQAGR
jgi:hypothetical protein